ncbi:UDP-N-acetylmuramoyl-tripeptide--D-alanyl-D-alanine ligase [Candidatus Saccharibacteria bacterium]|nr:UDP-N-acetylmuramoyl-tripeptide--D-alanyl-D-alanine ligase [Candidatus Saccharibacteria bacterium]
MFKQFIQKKLEQYVREYFIAHPEVKLIAVGGSVGKTTTKTNIATVLNRQFRVRMREGNHNTLLSAPLSILGIEYPENIRSVIAWLAVFSAAKKRIKLPADVDVIVQELGVDRIGEMAQFGSYLHPDIGVVTAVVPEHMEFFKTLDVVAEEEMTLANFSKMAIINRDTIEGKYAADLTNANITTYGQTSAAEYHIETGDFTLEYGYSADLVSSKLKKPLSANIRVIGNHTLLPVAAAFAVAVELGMDHAKIIEGLEDIIPVKGRMNVLRGLRDTILIDDTYNSSPDSAAAALQTLYSLDAPSRVAILGSMNELGDMAESAHKKIGELCDPALLSWVVTVGADAQAYIAPAAKARGCQVKSFSSAIQAGEFVSGILEKGMVVLAKGSQGGIYLEETLKILLHETHEDHDLVRQSPHWQKIKQDFFSSF